MVRRSLCIGLALAALLALPVSAGAVLPGTNGRIVFISGPAFGNTQLFLRPVIGGTGGGTTSPALATGLAQQHRHPTWSPDRTKIAFAEGAGAGPYDIYTLDLTTPGATAQNITNTPGTSEDRPAWSPDGTRIAYDSDTDIDVQTLAGGGILPLTTTLAPKAWKAAWSPDSQTLYYSVGDISVAPNGTNNDIRLYQQPANNSSAGTELLHVSGAHVFQPSISPDGTKLCYTFSTAPGNSTTALVVAASLSAPASFTQIGNSGLGDYNCTWSPDGTEIAYTEDYAGNGEVFMRRADAALPAVDLTNTAGTYDGNPDWAPDGRPVCPDSTVTTKRDTPLTFQVTCTDTGPAYERSNVSEVRDTEPAHGTLKQEHAGDPFTYTPNQGFVGTDSFVVKSADDFGFGQVDRGTVTIQVTQQLTPTLSCHGKQATIGGTAGNDTITGTSGRDVIQALGGNDTIRGGGGKDLICAGKGIDRASGGSGNDVIDGGAGRDRLLGGSGNDKLIGGAGADTLIGGGGRDTLSGGGGRDTLNGGTGRDRLNGGASHDTCRGGGAPDHASHCERRSSIP